MKSGESCRKFRRGLIGRVISPLIFFSLVFFLCASVAKAGFIPKNPWDAQFRPGVMAGDGDNETDFFFEFFIPVWGDNEDIVFLNPHLRLDDKNSREVNVGLGYRRLLFSDRLILGANVYYDTMRSRHEFGYQQVGFGLEALSKWLDVRFNYYQPVNDRRNRIKSLDKYSFGSTDLLVSHGYEEALKGFDAEVGVLVPFISNYVETRAYVGGYWYDSEIRQDIEGRKYRIEVRPCRLVNLQVEVKNDYLRETDTFIGGYFDIPFSMADLFCCGNPFKSFKSYLNFFKGARTVRQRMTEKVVRDRHVVVHAYREKRKRKVADIIYVNQDNQAPDGGKGTFKDPYSSFDPVPSDPRYKPGSIVYVFSWDKNADTYQDVSIALKPNMVLWGQWYRDPRFHLGGDGPRPILASCDAPVVILESGGGQEVRGLAFVNKNSSLLPTIFGRNVGGVKIHHNAFLGRIGGLKAPDIPVLSSKSFSFLDGGMEFGLSNVGNLGVLVLNDGEVEGNIDVYDNSFSNHLVALAVLNGGRYRGDVNVKANVFDGDFLGVGVANLGEWEGNVNIARNTFDQSIVGVLAGNVGPAVLSLLDGALPEAFLVEEPQGELGLFQGDINVAYNSFTGTPVGVIAGNVTGDYQGDINVSYNSFQSGEDMPLVLGALAFNAYGNFQGDMDFEANEFGTSSPDDSGLLGFAGGIVGIAAGNVGGSFTGDVLVQGSRFAKTGLGVLAGNIGDVLGFLNPHEVRSEVQTPPGFNDEGVFTGNVKLTDNTFQDGGAGVLAGNILGTFQGNLEITDNTFSDQLLWGAALGNLYGDFTGDFTVAGNTFTSQEGMDGLYLDRTWAGVLALNMGGTFTGNWDISGNTFQRVGLGVGALNSYDLSVWVGEFPIPYPTAQSERVAYIPTNKDPGYSTVMGGNINVTGNTVQDAYAGLAVANLGGDVAGDVNVFGNTISQSYVGIVAANVGGEALAAIVRDYTGDSDSDLADFLSPPASLTGNVRVENNQVEASLLGIAAGNAGGSWRGDLSVDGNGVTMVAMEEPPGLLETMGGGFLGDMRAGILAGNFAGDFTGNTSVSSNMVTDKEGESVGLVVGNMAGTYTGNVSITGNTVTGAYRAMMAGNTDYEGESGTWNGSFTGDFTVSNNQFSGNEWGPEVYTGSSFSGSISITGNTVTDTNSSGMTIDVMGGHPDLIIESNEVKGNQGHGIFLGLHRDYQGSVSIENNVAENNGRDGIHVQNEPPGDLDAEVSILSNDLKDNGRYGVYVYSCSSYSGAITVGDNNYSGNAEGDFQCGDVGK